MSDKATTISIVRRCAAAAGIAAVTLVAPAVAVVEGPAAVLAKAIPSTPVDTQGAPCPGAYYCIAPGPDPEVPCGTNPYVPYVAGSGDARESGRLMSVCPVRGPRFRDPGHLRWETGPF